MPSTKQIHKTLFIGVGGSGGTTLRFIHQEIKNYLQERGWDGELPACWQFLLMDVAGTPDGVSGSVPNVLTDPSSFFGLTDTHTTWSTFLDMMPPQLPEVVAGWGPELPLPGEPFKGAGQFRALGRLVAFTRIAEMKTRIDECTQKLGAADRDLLQVAQLLDSTPVLGNKDMHVYLVTSLGGGSGSGMFLDVSTVLEALNIKHVNVLYAPDVFDSLTRGGGNKGVVANTFGAMSELLSAFEGVESFSEADIAMLQLAGIAINLKGERTTDANIILGRVGENYEATQQNEVYHSAARILSAIALDGSLAEPIERYVLQNRDYLKPAAEFKSLKKPISTKATRNELATSLGMASVSTGREAFGQYAAERLTSFIVDQLQDNETALHELKTKKVDEFLSRARQFALQCRLGVPPGSKHLILVDLLGEGLSQIEETANVIKQRVVAQLDKPLSAGTLDPSAVQATIDQNFQAIRNSVGQEFGANRKAKALAWTVDAQARLLDATISSIVNDGMLHTIEYLKQMCVDLNATANDFDSNAQKLLSGMTAIRDKIEKSFAAVGERVKLALSSTEVSQRLELLKEDTAARLERGTTTLVAQLMKDFVVNAVEPLIAELEKEQSNFATSLTTSVAIRDRINELARDATPPHLLPARNVFFLDSPDSFKSNFESLLDAVYGGDGQADLNIRAAAREVLANAWQGRPQAEGESSHSQRWLVTRARWSTSVAELLDDQLKPTKASFEIANMNVSELEAIARKWQRTRTVVREYTTISMREYIYPEGLPDRTSEFLMCFNQALSNSGVMVKFDHDAIQAYSAERKTVPTIDRFINGVPLRYSDTGSDLTPAAKAAVDLMVSAGIEDAKAHDFIKNASGSASSVLVFSVIKEKTPPTLLASIGTPVYQQWAQIVANPELREDWYRLRRARTLPSFIPVSVPVIKSMIGGWVISRGLGFIPDGDIEEFRTSNGDFAIRLFDPEEKVSQGGYVKFPETILSGGVNSQEISAGEVLPALLESMLLGYVAITSGWLSAYARLAKLGTDLRELKTWIRTGVIENGDGIEPPITPIERLASAGTEEARKAAFLEYLDSRLAELADATKKDFTLDDIGEASREWELRRQIKGALEELKKEVASIADEDESVPL